MIAALVAGLLLTTQDQIFTSTAEVRSIEANIDGSIGISTTGAMLVRSKDGTWTKYTTLDGLPSNSVRLNASQPSGPFIHNYNLYERSGERWTIARKLIRLHSPGWGRPTPSISWKGMTLYVGLGELATSDKQTAISLPSKSIGTHFSAAASNGGTIWAAIYGDGIWKYDGKDWNRLTPPPGVNVQDVTALTREARILWVGTRRNGAFEVTDQAWKPVPRPSEPAAHDVHSMAWFDGSLYVGTANDGIVSYDGARWTQIRQPALTSDKPGALFGWASQLLVAQGSAGLDRLATGQWTAKAFPTGIPKRGAFFFGSEGNRLYVSQVGGWSEFDGVAWTSHLSHPELQNIAPTALLPINGQLWIGTQGKGLGLYDPASDKFQWFTESAGFKDDWITCLAKAGDRVFAGTFSGGCMVYDGQTWKELPLLKGKHVTAFASDEADGLYIATLDGLWRWTTKGAESLSGRHPGLRGGIAALANSPKGLWVGTNEGIYLLPEP